MDGSGLRPENPSSITVFTLAFFLPLAALVLAALTIVAARSRASRPRLFRILKPLTTCLILLTAALPGTFLSDRVAGGICLGLAACMLGDFLLTLPDDFFLRGLAAFLLGHLCYVYAFISGAATTALALPGILLALIGAMALSYLWAGLPRKLKAPVSVYVVVIAGMTALATARAAAASSVPAWIAAGGAWLFLISDLLLAIDRFRRKLSAADALVLGTYFSAQLLIALSVPLSGSR
jgi:uncharacterized membrane protein YhhN